MKVGVIFMSSSFLYIFRRSTLTPPSLSWPSTFHLVGESTLRSCYIPLWLSTLVCLLNCLYFLNPWEWIHSDITSRLFRTFGGSWKYRIFLQKHFVAPTDTIVNALRTAKDRYVCWSVYTCYIVKSILSPRKKKEKILLCKIFYIVLRTSGYSNRLEQWDILWRAKN